MSAWKKLTAELADGASEPEPGQVAELLADLGKSPDDLRQAVELLAQRRTWKAQFAASGSLSAEYAENLKRLESAEVILTDARTQYEKFLDPIARRQQQILSSQILAGVAERELRRTCTDAAAREIVADLDAKLGELRHQSVGQRQLANERSEQISKISMGLRGFREADYPKKHAEKADEIRSQQEARTSYLTAAEGLLAQADVVAAKLAKAEQVLLEP
ncbi:MAG: hypothetical protein EXS09_20820 [Gemmataceae bacterium]|nr:hypothetical protein [Gemmataceae bacterium]